MSVRGTKITEVYEYENKFDNALTSLWFCYYRFLFFRKLGSSQYEQISSNIVYDTFFKFMRYINLDTLKDGPQVTAFFNIVFRSIIGDKIRKIKRQVTIPYSLVESISGNIANQDLIYDNNEEYELNKSDLIQYVTDFIIYEFNNDYELCSNLQSIIKHKTTDVSEYSKEVLKHYREINGYTDRDIIQLAIDFH